MNLQCEGPSYEDPCCSPYRRPAGGLPLMGLHKTSFAFEDIADLLASGYIDIYKVRLCSMVDQLLPLSIAKRSLSPVPKFQSLPLTPRSFTGSLALDVGHPSIPLRQVQVGRGLQKFSVETQGFHMYAIIKEP